MNTFLQILLGLAAALFLVVGGFFLGQASAPSEIVDCLNWASANFEKPTVALLSNLCHGS
jgi:hypothetical protein